MDSPQIIITLYSIEGRLSAGAQMVEETSTIIFSAQVNVSIKGQRRRIILIYSDDQRHKTIARLISNQFDAEHTVKHIICENLWVNKEPSESIMMATEIIARLFDEADIFYFIVPSDFDSEVSKHIETKPLADLFSAIEHDNHFN